MENYLLIWAQNGYPEDGGGTYYKRFKSAAEMKNYVNDDLTKIPEGFEILLATYAQIEYDFKPTEKITYYEIEQKR